MAVKSIRRKTNRDFDNKYYEKDPFFQLLSKIKSPEEMERFKRMDRINKIRKGRRIYE